MASRWAAPPSRTIATTPSDDTLGPQQSSSQGRRSGGGAGAAAGGCARAAGRRQAARISCFQLLCVLGQWERALNQLKVASELDPLALPMAQMYGDAVRCEAVRGRSVRRTQVADDPRRAGRVAGAADRVAAASQAWASAPRRRNCGCVRSRTRRRSGGDIDGAPFEWIADADSRLGPVLEAIINGALLLGAVLAPRRIDARAARRPARSRLDAGPTAVRQRRRIAGPAPDALSRLGGCRPTAASRSRGRPNGSHSPPTPTTDSGSVSSPPTPAKRRCSTCARSRCVRGSTPEVAADADHA